MLRKLYFVCFCLVAAPTSASAIPSPSDIQQALAVPNLTIEDRTLSEEDLNIFYAGRDYHAAWSFAGQNSSEALNAFLNSLERTITFHGLLREDYSVDVIRKLAANLDDATQLKLELLVTDTLVQLAHDLHGDANDLNDIYPGWNFQRNAVDIPRELIAAVANNKLNEYFENLSPKNIAYRELTKALEIYRGYAKNTWPQIDQGPILHQGAHDARVAQLYKRLGAEAYITPSPKTSADQFDGDLRKALAHYQMANGLEPDGNLGPKTVASLNVSAEKRIDQIRANMERWRHMPDEYPPENYINVNIADAQIVIVEKNEVVFRGPVIVGRVDRKTPFIQSNIRSMIFNPSWHVPAKIAQKDILPKLRKDPHYLEKLGFTIRGNEHDPHGAQIDWSTMPEREFTFRLRQDPGDMNSLGRVKFDFDNDFAVYMHGTPHQELFKKNARDLSSGCIRLHDPEKVAEVLLASNPGDWTAERINLAIQSGKTHWIAFAHPMPLYVLYWTVFVDESGNINFRDDIYDYDQFLIENVGGSVAGLK